MKRLLSAILALLLLLSCFTGCKGDPTPTDSTQGNTENAEALTENPNAFALEENGVVYESLAQKAVVKTALAYLARSTRIQYDDVRFNPTSAPVEYRWQYSVRLSPEEYTSQYIGYTNCAAFTYDVYLAALDIRIDGYATNQLTEIKGKQRVYKYWPTGEETQEQMDAVEAEFRSNLKMGDIIVIRYNGSKTGNGHAMLYVGGKVLENVEGYKGAAAENTDDNGVPADAGYTYDIIHSTGSSYNYTKAAEKYEKHGTIQKTSVDSLFDESNGRYVFGKLESVAIIRPLATFDKDVPEDTQNRMLYMNNIIAEKLSSHIAGMTVNPGDTMTYTFSITNKNKTDVTLAVKDTLPQNVTYVSSENCTVDGSSLSWTVTVPAGKTENITYTVRVNDDAQPGHYVVSTEGSMGGVAVNCHKVFVGRTLKADEQQALLTAVQTLSNSQLRGMELVNALYSEVLGVQNILPSEFETVLSNIYLTPGDFSYLNWKSKYKNVVAPGLFGGRYVLKRDASVSIADQITRYENNRTRLPYPDQLMVGDILIAAVDAKAEKQKLYLYTGENMLDLLSGDAFAYADTAECLTPVMAYNRFAILRPSLMLDNKK